MFTGIIEEVGRIAHVEALGERRSGGRRLTVEASFAGALHVDQSVSVSGACQTVVGRAERAFEVVAIEETLRKTTLGALEEGDAVNLERALRPDGRLDGHFVQGHVDATGEVVGVEEEATDRLYHVRFDAAFAPYVIPVGSVAIDGVSLTVARLAEDVLTVAVIPHTYARTTVRRWREGARVNLEFDLLGKYVVRWLEQAGTARSPAHVPNPRP